MNNSLRVLFGASVLAVLFAAGPVMAAETVDVSGANSETGAESDNDNIWKVDNSGDTTVNNGGDVDNVAHAHANTGDNDQNMNTTGGGLESGPIDASTDWESLVNKTQGLCECLKGDLDVFGDFENSVTGYLSGNLNSLKVDNEGDLRVRNWADVLNSLSLYANTGKNDQNMNTTAGDMMTGGVGVDAVISNYANVSDTNGSGGSMTTVSVDATNSETGAESDNDNIVTIKNSGDKTVHNKADVDNIVTVKANTGKNNQNKNTTAGDLITGDVDVTTDVVNAVNVGDSCACSGGDQVVSADFSNETTGYQSDNKNALTVTDTGKVSVTNDAKVNNNLDVEADTGHNDQEKNTTAGTIDTGGVSIDFTATNEVNSN